MMIWTPPVSLDDDSWWSHSRSWVSNIHSCSLLSHCFDCFHWEGQSCRQWCRVSPRWWRESETSWRAATAPESQFSQSELKQEEHQCRDWWDEDCSSTTPRSLMLRVSWLVLDSSRCEATIPCNKDLTFIELSHLQFEKITFMRLFKLLSRNLRL